MEFYFLGTGAGLPSRQRNVSSLALTLYDERGTMWMFDCGEATQHQILASPLRLPKLEKLFITHMHGDHIFGIPGLLASRSSQGADTPLTVYGPAGLKRFIDTVLKASHSWLQFPIHVIELPTEAELRTNDVIFQDEQFTVRARLLEHGVPSYGFRIEEHDMPGTFYPDKAKAAGVPEGPLFARLKKGEQVVLPDGRTVDGADFVGAPIAGRTLAICGDTKPCDGARVLADGVDVLVHEATFMKEQQALAGKYNHSTATEAATLAHAAGVGKLVLQHISGRYQGQQEQKLLKEAQAIFPETVLACDHFALSVPLKRT